MIVTGFYHSLTSISTFILRSKAICEACVFREKGGSGRWLEGAELPLGGTGLVRWGLPRTALVSLILLLAICAASCSASAEKQDEVLIFAAASLKDVLAEVGGRFEERAGIKPQFNFAGSNVLALQLEAAGSTAVFLSADEHWMDYLERKQLIVAGTRRTVVSNQLVIIANRDNPLELREPSDLASAPFRFLSLANPEAVPAGRYAKGFLEKVTVGGNSIWMQVRDRVAPAPDARAALAMVEAQRDVAGIVYKTDAASSGKVRVVLDVPAHLTPEISYAAALIGRDDDLNSERAFLDFLGDAEALEIFRKHGFISREESARP